MHGPSKFPVILAAATLILSWQPDARAGNPEAKPFIMNADLWCPYTCEADADRPGYLVELTKEIFEAQGITATYKVIPWTRAYIETETGRAQVTLGLVPADTRNLLLNSEILGVDSTVLVMRSPAPASYTGVSILDGLRIGATAQYTYDGGGELDLYLDHRRARKDHIIDVFSPSPLDLLLPMLNAGRIDVFPENREAVRNAASRLALLDKISLIETGLASTIHVAFTPDDEGRRNLEIFDSGVRNLKASGRLDEIKARYGLSETSQNEKIVPKPILNKESGQKIRKSQQGV
jgi:polar amino acid transport system substrate-binding protein